MFQFPVFFVDLAFGYPFNSFVFQFITMARLSPFFGWSWLNFSRKPQSSNSIKQQIQSIEVHASITSNKDCSLVLESCPWSGTKNEVTSLQPYHEEQVIIKKSSVNFKIFLARKSIISHKLCIIKSTLKVFGEFSFAIKTGLK